MNIFEWITRWLRNRFAAEGPEPEVVSSAAEGREGDPLYVRVERWSDGSVFIEGTDATIYFTLLGRDNGDDARLWIGRAYRLLNQVLEEEP